MFTKFTTASRFITALIVISALFAPFVPLQARSPGQQGGTPPKEPPKRQVLPLDPLTSAERKLAEQIAREDPKVRELLGNRSQLISIALLFLKPEGEQEAVPTKPVAIDRHAEVLFRREDEAGVRTVVNLSKQSLVSADRVTSMELPLTSEDINQAAKLALADVELRNALGEEFKSYVAAAEAPDTRAQQFAITGLRLFSKGEDDPCTKHRCVQLMFRRGRDYLADTTVWVDLTERHVYVERGKNESH
jgi:Cu2+-containing amine oxidase